MVIIAFLVQLLLYLLIFLYDDYLGSLLTLILGAVCLGIWAVARLVELVERSRVSPLLYRMMFSGFLAPLAALLLYGLLRGGFDWLQL